MRVRAVGPVREQRHRLTPGKRCLIRAGHGQWSQPVPGLPGHPQRLPAGRQHPHIISSKQQPRAQLRRRADQMLAVIQHQQQLLPGQHPHHHISRRHPRLVPYPQRRGHGRRHQRRVFDGRQLYQPHPVREPVRYLLRYLTRQPGLAEPPGPVTVTSR
jgi:hypothetical protein